MSPWWSHHLTVIYEAVGRKYHMSVREHGSSSSSGNESWLTVTVKTEGHSVTAAQGSKDVLCVYYSSLCTLVLPVTLFSNNLCTLGVGKSPVLGEPNYPHMWHECLQAKTGWKWSGAVTHYYTFIPPRYKGIYYTYYTSQNIIILGKHPE